MIRSRRVVGAGLVACACALTIPAAGHAASLTVTNDTGTAVPLVPGTTLRNMAPEVTPVFTNAELNSNARTYYTLTVDGPAGPAITPQSCYSSAVNSPNRIKYAVNGVYNVTLNTYAPSGNKADSTCSGSPTTTAVGLVINAYVGIGAPAQGTSLLTRAPGSLDAIPYQFPLDQNPGSYNTEITYARGAALTNGTGPIQGDPLRDGPDTGVNLSTVNFYDPGVYTFLAQGVSTYGASPYSTPLNVKVQDPFDIVGTPFFSDSRGPRYTLSGTVRTKYASGKVRLYLKRNGAKKFRRVGAGKVRSSRTFKVRFTQRKTGRYSARFVFKGSRLVRGGRVTYKGLRFTRRVIRF